MLEIGVESRAIVPVARKTIGTIVLHCYADQPDQPGSIAEGDAAQLGRADQTVATAG